MPLGATGWQEICSVSHLGLQWAWFLLHACVLSKLWVTAERLKIWGSQRTSGCHPGVVLFSKSAGHWQEEQG